MSCCILVALALSLLSTALNLTGLWKDAGHLAPFLFGLTMVLAMLGVINDSDKRRR